MEGDVLEQGGLVAFAGEVVMGLSVLNQVGGELALGQPRIGGDVLALDLDGIQQRGGHLNLVGLLAFLIALGR